jgi:hypothetical protein
MRSKIRQEKSLKRNVNAAAGTPGHKADVLARLETENSKLRHQLVEIALKMRAMRDDPSALGQLDPQNSYPLAAIVRLARSKGTPSATSVRLRRRRRKITGLTAAGLS